MSKENVYTLIEEQLKDVFSLFGDEISDGTKKILAKPQKEIIVNFPVKLSNGQVEMFKGYRIQHNNLFGPYKGGLRFYKNIYLDECNALASWMTHKNTLQDLPLGGGKGGLKIDVTKYSDEDLEKISRNFAKALANHVGENVDIPAPDMGSNSQIMDWMNDEHKKVTHSSQNGHYTGKSIILGGSEGRTEATGYGVCQSVKEWAKVNNFDLKGKTFIMQGFGNVGSYAAKFLEENGMKMIAVGDHTGYFSGNINLNELMEYAQKNRGIKGFENLHELSKEDFFKTKCDIVVPAAMELQISEEIAQNLDCKLVVEGANGPTYFAADKVLEKRGIDVIPDILANSGGVVVSYFEWLQNKYSEYWVKEYVIKKLEDKMAQTFKKIHKLKNEKNITYRQACYYYTLKKIDAGYMMKGNIY